VRAVDEGGLVAAVGEVAAVGSVVGLEVGEEEVVSAVGVVLPVAGEASAGRAASPGAVGEEAAVAGADIEVRVPEGRHHSHISIHLVEAACHLSAEVNWTSIRRLVCLELDRRFRDGLYAAKIHG